MIFQPFETKDLNTSVIEDITPNEDGECITIASNNCGLSIELNTPYKETTTHCLYIDTDQENVIPLGMKHCGYEWEPVWTRKLN